MDAVATAAAPVANGLAAPASAVAAGLVQTVAAEQGAEGQTAGTSGTEASAEQVTAVQDAAGKESPCWKALAACSQHATE